MAQEYFSDLNYTLANEDTKIEHDLLPEGAERVFCIAGSGSRVLPLAAKNPKEIIVADMAEAQLFLVELRWAAVQALTYEEWLYFLGYRGAIQGAADNPREDRDVLFQSLKLSERAREYWVLRKDGWKTKGFIFLGKWERHFLMLGSVFRDYLRCDFQPIFEASTVEEQRELWEQHWPKRRFNAFIRIAASEYVFNKFLYKGHFAGSEGHRTESRPPYQFISEEFERMFKTHLVRKSYFMQMMFLGKIVYEEGLPFEAHRDVFERMKKSKTKLTYKLGNQMSVLPEYEWSFVSLSDTISYVTAEEARSLFSRIKGEGVMVIRSFMRAPPEISAQGWNELTESERWAWETDLTGVYQFHIYQKN